MKSSELRLLQLLNKNNNVQLDPEEVIFGSPRVSPDRRKNTWIYIYPDAEAWKYGRPTTTAYNRLHTGALGQDSVIGVTAHSRRSISAAVARVLTDHYDIPTETSELLQRTLVNLPDGVMVAVYDVSNHPLLYGSLTCKVSLGDSPINTVITQTLLSGFCRGDVGPLRVSDVIPIADLSGFSFTNVN